MKSFFKYLLVLLSGFFILFLFLFGFILSLSESEPVVEDNSYLEISLGGSLPEYVAPSPFNEITGDVPVDLKMIRENLEKAAVDERINGVILTLGFLQTGYAKIEELRTYIKKYRESNKKIYAYMEFGMTKEYLVASACDSIIMPESSNLFLPGVSAEITFYKNFFKKFGIEASFVHAGAYKNAPDTYTRSTISKTHREVIDNLLDNIYNFTVQITSKERGLDPKKVTHLIESQSGFTAKTALNEGLIDAVMQKSDIVSLLKTKKISPERVSNRSYAKISISSLGIRTDDKIAVVHISGAIVSGSNADDPVLGTLAGESTLIDNIETAANSRSTKAIILRIDSPGGSAIASDNIWEAVRKAAKKKPVVASISDYGASGGYYIAMGADSIVNSAMSLVGSIGVFVGKFSIGGLYNKVDMNVERYQRGKNAGLFSLSTAWSPSERKVIQRLTDDFYTDFVTKVALERKQSFSDINTIAQGRVWTGEEAKQNKLIDEIGSLYTAIDLAKKMADISQEQSVRLRYFPEEKGLFSEMSYFASLKSTVLSLFNAQNEPWVVTQLQNKPLLLMPYFISWK